MPSRLDACRRSRFQLHVRSGCSGQTFRKIHLVNVRNGIVGFVCPALVRLEIPFWTSNHQTPGFRRRTLVPFPRNSRSECLSRGPGVPKTSTVRVVPPSRLPAPRCVFRPPGPRNEPGPPNTRHPAAPRMPASTASSGFRSRGLSCRCRPSTQSPQSAGRILGQLRPRVNGVS